MTGKELVNGEDLLEHFEHFLYLAELSAISMTSSLLMFRSVVEILPPNRNDASK